MWESLLNFLNKVPLVLLIVFMFLGAGLLVFLAILACCNLYGPETERLTSEIYGDAENRIE